MLTANAYAAPSATEPLVPTTIERRDVGPHDVLIEIKYAGICHSDIHTVRGEWGTQQYPLTPGHEITAGIVTGIGSEVTRHKVGDRERGLYGQLLRRVRQLPQGRGAVLSRGDDRHLRSRSAATGRSPRVATPAHHSNRGFRRDDPGHPRARRRRAAALRRHHHLLPAAPFERPAKRWPSSGLADLGTWPSSKPTPWAPTLLSCPNR